MPEAFKPRGDTVIEKRAGAFKKTAARVAEGKRDLLTIVMLAWRNGRVSGPLVELAAGLPHLSSKQSEIFRAAAMTYTDSWRKLIEKQPPLKPVERVAHALGTWFSGHGDADDRLKKLHAALARFPRSTSGGTMF